MSILILEALGAGALLIFIVWWTMFSGRQKGELSDATENTPEAPVRPVQAQEHAPSDTPTKDRMDLTPRA